MDINRFTMKSQEALQGRKTWRYATATSKSMANICSSPCSNRTTAWCRAWCMRLDIEPESLARAVREELQKRPAVSGPGVEPGKVYVTQRLQPASGQGRRRGETPQG